MAAGCGERLEEVFEKKATSNWPLAAGKTKIPKTHANLCPASRTPRAAGALGMSSLSPLNLGMQGEGVGLRRSAASPGSHVIADIVVIGRPKPYH
jgi:hypothetical protein